VQHRGYRAIGIIVAGVALGYAVPTQAQQYRTTPARPDSAIDSAAVNALKEMSSYLRTLSTFQVHADITTEDVLLDGQKITTMNVAELVARRPDRLRLDVKNDKQRRLYFFDGKNFTLFAPVSSYYATVAAPSTINALADKLEDDYGITLPFVDLFRWGSPDSGANALTEALTGAVDIGPSAVEGVTCEQYAFRQDGLDWQVWIQEGDYPLPRRVVLTTLTDPARPQYTATYTWNLAPSLSDDAFVFDPPKDAKPITFDNLTIKGRPLTAAEKKP
jgi:hypothetical protein